MQGIIREYGLSHEAMKTDITRSLGMSRQVAQGRNWTAVLTDCVEEARHMGDLQPVEMEMAA